MRAVAVFVANGEVELSVHFPPCCVVTARPWGLPALGRSLMPRRIRARACAALFLLIPASGSLPG